MPMGPPVHLCQMGFQPIPISDEYERVSNYRADLPVPEDVAAAHLGAAYRLEHDLEREVSWAC
ncbi:MAG: hypothetical protein LBN10_11235 [Propionibacteriaceae bacterium]|nr:hypothetical protein [Propionibacteriaceae bacterium]